jgi:hypothetical protein
MIVTFYRQNIFIEQAKGKPCKPKKHSMKKIPWHGFFPGWVANPGSFSLIFPLLYR